MRPCNFCQSHRARLLFAGYGFDRSTERFELHECTECGLVRVEPPLTPTELAPYYRTEYYGSADAKFTGPMEALVRRGNRRRARTFAALLPRQAATGSILDIGCGRGLFVRALRELGFAGVGTELPGFSLPKSEQGLSFVQARAESLPFCDGAFAGVSIWHVLEHTTDPAAVLREVARVLNPGGVVTIAVPNFDSWQARYFGRHWFHLDLPRHLYHFRTLALCRFLSRLGFDVVRISTQSWDQNLYGFVQSSLNALFWKTAPNGLYQALKKHAARPGLLALSTYLALAGAVLPIAVLENMLASTFGRGATLVLYARRSSPA